MVSILRLIRLPNVFTALADIIAGYFIATFGLAPRWSDFALLCASSASLYLAGMALNDFADREEDARERPGRPIPSGAVSASQALVIGLVLITVGIACALVVGHATVSCALALAVAIAGYDFIAKGRTFAGPLTLGVCRFLNVLLGMSAAFNSPGALDALRATKPWELPWLPAIASGFYGAGVTAFSAQEEHGKSQRSIVLGWIFTALGFGAAAYVFTQARNCRPCDWNVVGSAALGVLLMQLVSRTRALYKTGGPNEARALVLAGVKGYCLLDCGMILLYAGKNLWAPALAAVLMLFPGAWIRKALAQREA